MDAGFDAFAEARLTGLAGAAVVAGIAFAAVVAGIALVVTERRVPPCFPDTGERSPRMR